MDTRAIVNAIFYLLLSKDYELQMQTSVTLIQIAGI